MPDVVRARLAEALWEHRIIEIGIGCNGCSCGDTNGNWAAHAVDVLLSLEGVAIVALPEPDEGGNYWYDRNYVYADSDGLVMTKYGTTFGTADEVRRIAAAFLAAADAAEAVKQ